MENGVITVEQLKKQFGEFEDTTSDARALSEKCRDYRDLKQWTPDQMAELARRKQAPLVIPKIPEKVDFLVGLELQQRTEPRARLAPRSMKMPPMRSPMPCAMWRTTPNSTKRPVTCSSKACWWRAMPAASLSRC